MASGEFLARIKLALEGKEKVVSGLAETQQAVQKLSKTKITTIFDKEGLVTGSKIEETFSKIKPAVVGATSGMQDFQKALSRVIVVAPIWMAFRTVIQAVTSTLSEGFSTWEEFDRQLIKSKAVIHDFSGTTEEAMIELEDTIRNFSKDSGIALDQLTSAFYRFGTVGIAFEDALSGAIASAKLAKSTLGDVDTIARSLAMTYRLLGDTIDKSLTPMEKQESLAGKIFHLWRTNAFEANEFASSLNNFASTANIANFTTDQTISLLAALGTAGVQGARGGTLLKTAIQKLVENLDKLAPQLGLAVNPELETTFSLFMRVLEAINKLSQTKGIPTTALESIKDIFGGVRGGQVVSALNALLPELKKNLEDLGRDPQEFIKGLNNRFEEVKNSVSGQIDIFRNLKKLLGEAFIQGITGGKDFLDSLHRINTLMNTLVIVAGDLGTALRQTGMAVGTLGIGNLLLKNFEDITKEAEKNYAIQTRILKALNGEITQAELIGLITEIETTYTNKTLENREKILEILSTTVKEKLNEKELQIEITKQSEIEAKNEEEKKRQVEERKQLIDELSTKLQDRLKLLGEELKILKLQQAGTSEIAIEFKKLEDAVSVLVDRYNELRDASGELVKPLDKMEIQSIILSGKFDELLEKFKSMKLDEKEINHLADIYVNIAKAKLSEVDKLVQNEIDLLKLRGANSSQLLSQEIKLKSLVYGEDAIANSLKYRLELEKEITKEKLNQVDVSNETITLYKIATKEGLQTATAIADFLSGAIDYNRLKSFPRVFETFQKYFPQKTEAYEAAQFFGIPFRGNKGIGGGRYYGAPGGQVPVQEMAAINAKEVSLRTEIQNLNVTVKQEIAGVDKDKIAEEIQTDIAEKIRTDPKVREAISDQIEEF